MDTLDVKLLKRTIGQRKKHQSIKSLYGDKTWVNGLDIVNELGGHTGCVNALSWSSGGNFLASGSDDTYLNIWEYNPANFAKPFTLNTSVSTGHTNNIFSVKFMPHSNDRTVVTCAGDSEVRVFDLEYSGGNRSGPNGGFDSSSTRSRRFNAFFGTARWLNEESTNARVYRSHSDRAKRIVTESSPYLFLSCSEDGEVRQWDLRQPSSAYPAAHSTRRLRMRNAYDGETTSNIPPPLISYKKYELDLNSISCSGSQPYYIALGGAHLHCFLHDRRMLGRDISDEQGRPGGRAPVAGTAADEGMREATRCVRRFAPNNKWKMGTHDTGHITSCKISDARPNELIASWSGDHIYSFDIVRSPVARDLERQHESAAREKRLHKQSAKKRKHTKGPDSSSSLAEGGTARRRVRKVPDEREEIGQTALRVRFENGETEDIPVGQSPDDRSASLALDHDLLLTEAQKQSERVAKSLVRLRNTLFDFSASLQDDEVAALEHSSELTPYTAKFTQVLGEASSLLPQLEDIMRSWSYPVNPTEEDVTFQNTLRHNRQRSWRFVQAAGCLAKTLGGKLQTLSSAPDPRLAQFAIIKPAPREDKSLTPKSRFCYDFLKAILLWLNGGRAAVLDGFRKPADMRGESSRFLFDPEDTPETMLDKLHDHLISFADKEKPIIDLGTSKFERDVYRNVFPSQEAAVRAFTRALAGIELRTDQGISANANTTDSPSSSGLTRLMDRGAAVRFWGLKVGRSLLLDAGEGVTFAFVQRAFGGLLVNVVSNLDNLGHAPHVLSSDDEDERIVEAVDVVKSDHSAEIEPTTSTKIDTQESSDSDPQGIAVDADMSGIEKASQQSIPEHGHGDRDIHVHEDDSSEEEGDNNDDDDNTDRDRSDNESDDDNESAEEDDYPTHPLYRRRMAYGRSRERSSVNLDVPYTSHTKVYKGHCNTRTVKDVNYYGLDDEYVVSGSDDGNFFIWDRKTGQILNILEGDGEVVNVVQGHPYEPMIACSGIDSTIKIFGQGDNSRERTDALTGVNIANPGDSVHSSLRFGGRARRTRNEDDDDQENADQTANIDADEPVLARNGLGSRRAMNRQYEITTQNDVTRRRGIGEALVTEGMFARFAAVLQQGGQFHGITAEALAGQEGQIVIDPNNCLVM